MRQSDKLLQPENRLIPIPLCIDMEAPSPGPESFGILFLSNERSGKDQWIIPTCGSTPDQMVET